MEVIQSPLVSNIDLDSQNTIDHLLESNKDKVNELIIFDNYVQALTTPKNFDEYIEFNKEVNNILYGILNKEYKGKSEEYKKALYQSNIANYSGDQTEDLIYQIKVKSSLYRVILCKAIEKGKLDNILTIPEQQDIINIIKSGIFMTMDEIFVKWFSNVEKEENKGIEKRERSDLYYGGVKDGKLVPYKEFIKDSKINDLRLSQVSEPDLKQYLQLVSKFLKEGQTKYKKWVQIENFELNTWKNKDSNISIIGPMEDYYYEEVLAEPELDIYIKQSLEGLNKKMEELSEKHFNKTYNMETTNFSVVESILSGGEANYSGSIGKSFPNDEALTEKKGNFIFFRPSGLNNIIENASTQLEKLFASKINIDVEKTKEIFTDEVTYHEYGHSLFIKGHSSKLEEIKATLFYFLHLSDEFKEEEFTVEKIESIIHFCLVDSMRNLDRIEKTQYEEYTILTRIVLSGLFENELLKFNENNKLEINIDQSKFKGFLNSMTVLLEGIKGLYENKNKENSKKGEEAYINELVKQSDPFINKIINKIKN